MIDDLRCKIMSVIQYGLVLFLPVPRTGQDGGSTELNYPCSPDSEML